MRRRALLIGLLAAGAPVVAAAGPSLAAAHPSRPILAETLDATAGLPASVTTPASTAVPASTLVPASTSVPASTAVPATTAVPPSTVVPAPSASAGGQQPQPTVGDAPHNAPKPKGDDDAPATSGDAGDGTDADGGVPTAANPTFSEGLPGPAPIGVPNFFIDKFRIPPFLLPIYQAAGIEYGVRWEVLAGINEIETDYGRNLNVSSAGALGWMQFMPSTWRRYGVDANHDGKKDPFNPVDAIFAAARYLKAAGAATDVRKAIFAYNHADWYVDSVLMRARLIGGLPSDLVGGLTGLTQGEFPVAAKVTYADRPKLHGSALFARAGAAATATQDARVTKVGTTKRLGRFVQLRDVYGNTYTYGNLAVAGREHRLAAAHPSAVEAVATKERVFAHPARTRLLRRAWQVGAKVVAGTVLGRIGKTQAHDASHLLFEIRPAGRGAPRIDPKPILDGWKLLESTAIYRASGKNPFFGPDAKDPSIGQILLMSKETLQQRVLDDSRISIYDCGRSDIRSGAIDRRVLATLELLSASGLKPTVSNLECGHDLMTVSGNVSEHSSGDAVDIAAVNGIPILGHQGPGSITDLTIRRLLTLQGTMKPHQIISLMTFDGADNTLSLPDHNDHIHIGFREQATAAAATPSAWSHLMRRLGNIDNPTVSLDPSRYAVDVPPRTAADELPHR
jgi:hypothetical protein